MNHINNCLSKGRTFKNFVLIFNENIPNVIPHNHSTYIHKSTSTIDKIRLFEESIVTGKAGSEYHAWQKIERV